MSLLGLGDIAEIIGATSEAVAGVMPVRRQIVPCPTCGTDVGGLLAGCVKPRCISADIDFTRAYERGCEQ